MAARNYGQYSGLVSALEQVGERWAMLIVRDLLVGPRRYSDLKQGLPRIPTNILSTRLKDLNQAGIVRRMPLAHGLVYTLTDYGRGLEDAILALERWGFTALDEADESDPVTADSISVAFRAAFRPDAAAAAFRTVYDLLFPDFGLTLVVDGGTLAVTRAPATSPPATSAHLVFATDARIHDVISGRIDAAQSVQRAAVRVLSGDPVLLERFTQTFRVETAHTIAPGAENDGVRGLSGA
ncbi:MULTISPECIES: helix-turn-helix domain-containing protein [unclassified Salinibacterium]|uniref:winged helix-turn-helix transcriptional regulator n=1 Tax=unclassified Salinibacterium TaxID=2632331 RepID=UPI00141E563C|nr:MULTISPECIES: helix-turn-helix domain-containing protein [unclassified Salinibacterium]